MIKSLRRLLRPFAVLATRYRHVRRTVLVLVLSTPLLLGLASCSVPIQTVMTEDEQQYYESSNDLFEEVNQTWETVPAQIEDNCAPGVITDPVEIVDSCLNMMDELENVLRDQNHRARKLSAPPLFDNYHAQYLLFLDGSLDLFLTFKGLYDRCWPSLKYGPNMPPGCQEEAERMEAGQYDNVVNEVDSYAYACDHEIDQINRELRERATETSGPSSNLSAPKLYVSYQPTGIPLVITVDQTGQVFLSSEASIPTPIGVFSVGVETKTEDLHVLKIIHGGQVNLYDMGNEQFVIKLEFIGKALVRYDGEGNIEINMDIQ